jgi:threonine/homoserine/homoserine lactone efflux protein
MPDFATLAIFAGACLALTMSPGPDMLLIGSRSISQGRLAGFATLAGIQMGTYCHALAAALGLSELFVILPAAYDVVRYVGAAYLLFLAWQTFRSKGIKASTETQPSRDSVYTMFRQGLFTNLLNPKMVLFVLALFPQFVKADDGSVVLQIMTLATILNVIGLVVNGFVIFTASKLGSIFSRQKRYRRVPQILLGTVFTGLAVRLVVDGRR